MRFFSISPFALLFGVLWCALSSVPVYASQQETPSDPSSPVPLYLQIDTSLKDPQKEIFIEPEFEGLSLTQKVIGSAITSSAVAVTSQIPYSIQLDVQAGKSINLNPAHLYTGFSTYYGQMLFPTAITILSFELFRGDTPPEELTTTETIGYSLTAGAISGIASSPFELKNTRARYVGYDKVMNEILTARGYPGLMRGVSAVFLRDAIYGIGVMGIPVMLNPLIPESLEDSAFVQGGLGMAGGMLVGVATAPIEYIRSQMHGADPRKPVPGYGEVIRGTLDKKGIHGLMKGWEWRALRIGTIGATVAFVGKLVSDYQLEQNASESMVKHSPSNKPTPSYAKPPQQDRLSHMFQTMKSRYTQQSSL